MSCGSNEMLRFSITTFSLIPVGSPRGSFFARAKFNPFVWNRKLCFLFRVKKQTIFQVYWFDLPKPFIFPVLLDKCMFVCVRARDSVDIFTVYFSLSLLSFAFFLSRNKISIAKTNCFQTNAIAPSVRFTSQIYCEFLPFSLIRLLSCCSKFICIEYFAFL